MKSDPTLRSIPAVALALVLAASILAGGMVRARSAASRTGAAQSGAAQTPAPPGSKGDDASSPAAALRAQAEAFEARGELSSARTAWLSTVTLLPVGPERDWSVAAARRIDARLALRQEIVAAVPYDKKVFAELGIERADDEGLMIAGKRVAWNAVSIDLLDRAAAAGRASRDAQNGVVFEALSRGNENEKRAALVTAGKRYESKDMDAADAFAAVAYARNEAIPVHGYAFRKETWTSLDVLEAKAAASGLEDLGKKLETATAAQRGAFVTALEALGPEGQPRLVRALETRWSNACKALAQGPTLQSLTAVADARRELDTRRKHALDLIFDEDKYFYPYNPPECPPEKVPLYAGVQQEVDTRVSAVREAWKSPRRATQPAPFRAALAEIAWLDAFAHDPQKKSLKLAFALPAEIPEWTWGIDREAESADVKTFAWDAKERAALQHDALVEALNARAWKVAQSVAAATARSEEQKQVLVTNEYRKMFGRCALAWNPQIQIAARGHSDYMANSGDFGHYEKDPARKTPEDRLRLVGYKWTCGENCSMGDTSADGAHTGWIHSSGHHRNILTASHREMAASCESLYWTQNFGDGHEFDKELAHKP